MTHAAKCVEIMYLTIYKNDRRNYQTGNSKRRNYGGDPNVMASGILGLLVQV